MVLYSTMDHTSSVLHDLYSTRKHADLVLIAGDCGKRFNVHKSVISASTEYFDIMFSGTFKESLESEIVLKDINAHNLEIIIKYLYCGSIEIKDVESALNYWTSADLFHINGIIYHVIEFLNSNMDYSHCLEVWLMARRHHKEELELNTLIFVAKYLDEVHESRDFVHLNVYDFRDLIVALNHITSGLNIIDMIISWINDDRENRIKYLKKFISIIDLSSFYKKVWVNNLIDFCTNTEELCQIYYSLSKICFQGSESLLPNYYDPLDHFIVALEINDHEYKIVVYDIGTKQWSEDKIVKLEGALVGIWRDSSFVLVKDVDGKAQIILDDNHQNKKVMEFSMNMTNPIYSLVEGDQLYLLKEKHCYQIDLLTGMYMTIEASDFTFVDITYTNKTMFYVVKKPDNKTWLANYMLEKKLWSLVAEIPLSDKYLPGSCVGFNDNIYFSDELFLHYSIQSKVVTIEKNGAGKVRPIININGKLYGTKDFLVVEFWPEVNNFKSVWKLNSDYPNIRLYALS